RHGYPDKLSAGAVAAAGTLGMLIPPSVVIVLYGILSEQSIERLLIAGIVPGILTAVLYTGITAWLGRPNALVNQNVNTDQLVFAKTTNTQNLAQTSTYQPEVPSRVNESNLDRNLSRFSGIRALAEAASIFVVVVGG